jgi:hypothetical protein
MHGEEGANELHQMRTLPIANEVWLAGKGPSLDTFDWTGAGWCRVGINQAALVVPGCYAAIARDQSVMRIFQECLPRHIWLIRRRGHVALFPGFARTVEIDKHPDYNYQGTATHALRFLHMQGAKLIHMVGFDAITNGQTHWAKSMNDQDWQGVTRDGFSRITHDTLRIIKDLGVECIWH